MKFYNSSEQTREQLSTDKTYTTDVNKTKTLTKTSKKEISEDIIFYLVKNKQAIQDAIKEMPPEKAQKVEEKIKTIENNSQKEKPVSEEEKINNIPHTSPVEISVTPEEASAPK